MLESVQKALKFLKGSFINHNNEIIFIPKFNVYTLLDDVETEDDFKVKMCEWFSRDCCCALRYSQQKRLDRYYQENTEAFNFICGTNFTVEQMEHIYTKLGNGIKRELAKRFVKSGFDLSLLQDRPKIKYFCETTEEYLEHTTRCASCRHSKGNENGKVYCYNSYKNNYPYAIDNEVNCLDYEQRSDTE